jgi:hypothetical protein
VTLAGDGGTAGAVYTADDPLVESVPQADPLHPGPARLQVTAVFEVPVTLAVIGCVPLARTDALVGLILSIIAAAAAATTVRFADADLV